MTGILLLKKPQLYLFSCVHREMQLSTLIRSKGKKKISSSQTYLTSMQWLLVVVTVPSLLATSSTWIQAFPMKTIWAAFSSSQTQPSKMWCLWSQELKTWCTSWTNTNLRIPICMLNCLKTPRITDTSSTNLSSSNPSVCSSPKPKRRFYQRKTH